MNSFQSTKSCQLISLICASALIGGTIAAQAPKAFSQPNIDIPTPIVKPVPIEASPSKAVIEAIRQDVAQNFGVEKIDVVSFSPQSWPDGCLGLPRGKEACTTAIVLGWRIEVSDGLQTWFYRTDTKGNILRLEANNVLPSKVAKTLLQRVAKDNRIAPAKLKIAAVKPANFDGCLGIYRPNQACTKILIRGWQAIVTSSNRTYVYHLSQDASRIAQNNTASGAGSAVRVSFELFGGGEIPALESQVVFQSTVSGSLIGSTTTITLTEDGNVTEWTIGPTIKSRPIVRKTLTPKQVEAFKQALQNRRFRNLNGLSYLTSAALADYPTTTYQSQDIAMQFIDLEKKSLPRSLQQLIRTWEALIQA
jgi:hypothetical protein